MTRRHLFLGTVILFAGTALVAFLVTLWAVGSSGGANMVMAAAGLKTEGLEGRLLGPLSARSVEWRRPNLLVTAEGVRFDWTPLGLLRGRFHVTALTVDTISIATPPSKERGKLPLSLEPPLTIQVDRADVKSVRMGTLAEGGKWTPGFEVNDIALVSVASGDVWRFDSVGAKTAAGRLDLKGSVGAVRPFKLDITATLTGEREGRRYSVSGRAQGELAKFEARVKGEEGGVTGEATIAVEPYEAQPLRHVRGKLAGIDVNAFVPAAPRTAITVEADLAATGDGALAGTARLANAQAGPIDQQRLPVSEARGRLHWKGRRYELTQAAIGFAGGGSAVGDVLVDGERAEAKLAVSRLDLASWHSKLRATQLAGNITAHATKQAQSFELKLSEPRFEIAGRASIENRRLTVAEARVARAESVALLQGSMALDGHRDFEVTASLEHVDPSRFAKVPSGDISGKLRAKGSLSPSLAGEATLELAPSRLAELSLNGRATLTGEAQRLSRVDVEFALADARLKAQGAFGRAGDALAVQLAAPDLAAIGKALGTPVAGALNVDANLTGTFAAPAGKFNANGTKLVLPGGISIATATARLELGTEAESRLDGAIEITNLVRKVAGGTDLLATRATVTTTGSRANQRTTLDAALPAELAREGLVPAAAANARAGRLRLVLQGGLDEKGAAPSWKGRIESGSLTGTNPISLTAPATLSVARDLVELGDVSLKGDYGEARLELTRWTPTRIEARGHSQGLLTRPLVRALGLPSNPRSNLVMAGDWDIKVTDTVEGFVRMKRIRGDVRLGEPPVALGIEELTASIEAARGDVKATLSLRGGQVGKVDIRASTQVRGGAEGWTLIKEAPLAGEIDADMPTLGWAADWLGPDAQLQGALKGKVTLAGTVGSPSWRGNVALEGLQLREPGLGFDIDSGRVALTLNGQEVVIDRLELSSAWRQPRRAERRLEGLGPATGTISGSGRIDFATRTGSIVVKADKYPVSQHPTRFVVASGEAKVEAKEGGLTVVGAFKADAGWFGIADVAPPSLGEDVMIDRGGELQPASTRDRQRLTLDLRVGLGDQLYFSGRGLSTRLAGEVRLRGEPGRSLLSTGSIRADGGTYDAYGQKLAIERGVLNFQGPLDNPGLNVLAVRTGLPVVAGVEILGNVARPRVQLYSRPDVPDHEKLSWLVLGRGPSDASEGDAATLLAAANAMLGGNPENRRMLRGLGLDEVRVGRGDSTSALGALPQSTVAGKTGATSGSEVFTVGKRLTKDIYVSYQHSLADAEATLRFTYQLTKQLQLLLIAGDKPGVDAVYRFTFE
ncbi:translocation/assembly module TamB domain-containing protein [Usitatibacter palustris]|uniref:Translocation and assembly module TamB C-terminal domain-containing protein n=1 Tax=Usitatibacter palustris TaxID=2732487 RepID=A0A6M4HE74_9PROT|nr:translocation/assembly module TamB domain-containing protein [Usitatibacter palustris]QJR16813.1 hypothetical protein DSM104440_03649 [Usitatibacter palustris]